VFYGSTVKLPLTRTPVFAVLNCVSDVGLVPQTITIWNVNDLPMSAFVKVLDSCWLTRFCPGVRVNTWDVSVNGAEPAPSITLIWTSA